MRTLLLVLLAALSAGAQATYVKTDTATGANYKGVYGQNGSAIALTSSNPPSGASYTVINDSTWNWQAGSYGGQCWYNTSFQINLNWSGTVELYAIDWDNQGRTETISVNGSTPQKLSAFTKGAYLVYNVTGTVTFTITANTGPNAVISAIFFDTPAVTPPPTTHSVALTWTASTSGTVTEYLILRNGTLLASVMPTVTSYTDSAVVSGQTYTYTVLAVIAQSVPSNPASASVP